MIHALTRTVFSRSNWIEAFKITPKLNIAFFSSTSSKDPSLSATHSYTAISSEEIKKNTLKAPVRGSLAKAVKDILQANAEKGKIQALLSKGDFSQLDLARICIGVLEKDPSRISFFKEFGLTKKMYLEAFALKIVKDFPDSIEEIKHFALSKKTMKTLALEIAQERPQFLPKINLLGLSANDLKEIAHAILEKEPSRLKEIDLLNIAESDRKELAEAVTKTQIEKEVSTPPHVTIEEKIQEIIPPVLENISTKAAEESKILQPVVLTNTPENITETTNEKTTDGHPSSAFNWKIAAFFTFALGSILGATYLPKDNPGLPHSLKEKVEAFFQGKAHDFVVNKIVASKVEAGTIAHILQEKALTQAEKVQVAKDVLQRKPKAIDHFAEFAIKEEPLLEEIASWIVTNLPSKIGKIKDFPLLESSLKRIALQVVKEKPEEIQQLNECNLSQESLKDIAFAYMKEKPLDLPRLAFFPLTEEHKNELGLFVIENFPEAISCLPTLNVTQNQLQEWAHLVKEKQPEHLQAISTWGFSASKPAETFGAGANGGIITDNHPDYYLTAVRVSGIVIALGLLCFKAS